MITINQMKLEFLVRIFDCLKTSMIQVFYRNLLILFWKVKKIKQDVFHGNWYSTKWVFFTGTLGQKLHSYLSCFDKSFFSLHCAGSFSNSHPRATITEPAFFYTPLGKIRDVGCILKPNFSSRFTARRTRN